jgi:hypothetical protein
MGIKIRSNMLVVYIASPYTIGDKEDNVLRQIDAADEIMNMGYCPIVPLFTHYQDKIHPREYNDWMKIDFEKIIRSDVVLRLPGISKGADKEVAFAKARGKSVFYSLEELKCKSVVYSVEE